MKWTIRKKFLLGYFILFTFAAFTVHQVMKVSLETNSQLMIESELTKLEHTTREHMKQFTLLHPPKQDLFKEYGGLIAQELSKLHKQSVALYDQDGHFLYEAIPIDQPKSLENQTFQTDLQNNQNRELMYAFTNKAAFTPVDVKNGKLIYFSYPVYIHDHFYGVLRFTGDYTDMFAHNEKILYSFTILTISLFVGVFFISLLLTSQIIKPLLRLTKATKQVAAGQYDADVQVKTGDELEELAKNFIEMKQKIKDHIDMIEQEKDKVMLLEKSRTAFFNNVTHELKTPLTTISGYAQIIGDQGFDDLDFLQKAADKIRTESERLNTMVIELIELSKREADPIFKKREAIHILPLLTSICEDMSLKARKQQMEIEVTADDLIVCGKKDELRQVIINVLDNAIKYGVNGKRILVSIYGESITVTNDSEEVAQPIIEHAFEPFVHTQRKGSSGLGLYICKQIISNHNGTISLSYENGKVMISIHLPRWQQNGNNC